MSRMLENRRRTRVGLRAAVVAGAVAIGMAAGPGQASAQNAAPYPPASCATVKADVLLVSPKLESPKIRSTASWALGSCKIGERPVTMQVILQSRINRGSASPLPWNNVNPPKTFKRVSPRTEVSFDTECKLLGSPKNSGYQYRVLARIVNSSLLPFGGFPLFTGVSTSIVAPCKA